MGSDLHSAKDALPWHRVTVDGFWMDATEVTNEQFERFVKATGYVTTAERPLSAKDYPGTSATDRKPAGIVFSPPDKPVSLDNPLAWWKLVPGANWRHPRGPGSDIRGKEKHPVVQVSWDDAVAYTKWAGKRLPTEAEWEYAARGGLERQKFAWGNELRPDGKWMANTYQGSFPMSDEGLDGHRGTAPARSYPPNAYGLYDVVGNVWEWVADWYRPDYYAQSPARNPTGPSDSLDPEEPGVKKRVQRGGSFLCADNYCQRYDVGARDKGAPDSGAEHIGFRCVKNR